MLREFFIFTITIALLATQPVFAKGGGEGDKGGSNGGGKGNSGGSQGNGNGGGGGYSAGSNGGQEAGKGSSGSQSNGNGSGKNEGSAAAASSQNAASSNPGLGSSNARNSNIGAPSRASTITADPAIGSASPRISRSVTAPTSTMAASSWRAVRESGTGPTLPSSLIPRSEASAVERAGFVEPLTARAGIPGQIVQACRTSIVTAALPYGAIRVDAASAGQASRMPDGGLTAPLEVRVEYARVNARQVRRSRIACRLNAAGAVVALR
jgi:hypothetical protein